MEEYEFEELADMGIEELGGFIDSEKHLIEEEHNFMDKLNAWDMAIMHLSDERIPENMDHLHELNVEVGDKLAKLRDFVEENGLKQLRIKKEEEQVLTKLKEDVKHKDWRAVHGDIDENTKEEKEVLRLDKELLKGIHARLKIIERLTHPKNMRKTIEADLKGKDSKELEKIENYYFLKIYHFVKSYAHVFKGLWKKEKRLFKKTRRIGKKLK